MPCDEKTVQTAMDFGAEGIDCGLRPTHGRDFAFGMYREGKVPLPPCHAIDYGFAEANTVYGKIG